MIFGVVILVCAVLAFGVFAQQEDQARGQSIESFFPREVRFEDNGKAYDLHMTGASTRKKFFVTVYHVAHYMEPVEGQHSSESKFQEVMRANKVKQLTMRWSRNLEAEKVQEGYRQSFKNALEGHSNHVQNEINQYIQFFSDDVKKNDEHQLRWIPEGKIEVIINGGAPKVIDNKEFAQVLWSIWFGNKSVVNREQLVALMR